MKNYIKRNAIQLIVLCVILVAEMIIVHNCVSDLYDKSYAELNKGVYIMEGEPYDASDRLSPSVTIIPSTSPTPIPTNTPTPTLTSTPTPIPTNTPTPEPTELPKIYDISLEAEYQWYILDRCQEQGVEFELALSTIWRESRYRASVTNKNSNDTMDAGLFQINECNWDTYESMFPGWDPWDPYDNIDAGIYHIKKCMKYDKKPSCFMMVYNMGYSGASKLWKQGVWSSAYSRGLVDYMENTLPKLKLIDY